MSRFMQPALPTEKQEQLRSWLDEGRALSLSNRTWEKAGLIHWGVAECVVADYPGTYEVFIGPDGQRMIRRREEAR